MKMRNILTLSLFFIVQSLMAATATLRGDAPSHVAVGEQFRLSYTVNSQDVDGFRVGTIPSAFEVLMGPSTSSRSSFQIVNGKTTSSVAITYTYILVATKTGSFTVPPAKINVGGESVSSNPVQITVSGQAPAAQGGQGSSGQQPQASRPSSSGGHISGSDLFITVSANKKRVHEQEPILLTYKVYTLVNLTQLEGKMPDLKGFHTQEVKLPASKSFSVETYNGRNYRTVTWSQYVMFPQVTGKLTIPSITFKGLVVMQNRNIDPFEAFFNGGSAYTEVKKNIEAPSLTIQVDPLPARPAGFSGGVGSFRMTAKLDKDETRANEPVTLSVIIEGTGNMKLLKEPIVNLPKDFDKYDAKVTDKTRLTKNGVEGTLVYDFLMVPRHAGSYTIPPVEFTYYDTGSNSYKTLQSDPFTLKVGKGVGGGTTVTSFAGQEDLKMLNQDIRYIKQGGVTMHAADQYFFGSTLYWMLLAVPLLVFIVLVVIFRRQAVDAANIGKMRGKKASKVATRRLKVAGQMLKSGKDNQFYDEVLRALWGYVGDKLNMPVEQLSKENVSEKLADIGIADEVIRQFISALDDCEFARYAPGDAKGNMAKLYADATDVIEKIEKLKG